MGRVWASSSRTPAFRVRQQVLPNSTGLIAAAPSVRYEIPPSQYTRLLPDAKVNIPWCGGLMRQIFSMKGFARLMYPTLSSILRTADESLHYLKCVCFKPFQFLKKSVLNSLLERASRFGQKCKGSDRGHPHHHHQRCRNRTQTRMVTKPEECML